MSLILEFCESPEKETEKRFSCMCLVVILIYMETCLIEINNKCFGQVFRLCLTTYFLYLYISVFCRLILKKCSPGYPGYPLYDGCKLQML